MSALVLLPNLGAEELEADSGAWRQSLALPPVASAARLWSFLFPADARVLGLDPERAAWPEALRDGAGDPALSCLRSPGGLETIAECWPWLASPGAHAFAAGELGPGTVLRGAPGDVVLRVNDKAFAWRAAEEAGAAPRALVGAWRAFDPDDLGSPEDVAARVDDAVRAWPEWARERPTLKPRLGTSGRGHVRGRDGAIAPETLAKALPRLRARGGALLEPWLVRERDHSVQLFVDPDGGLRLLGSLQLLTSEAGGFLGHRGELDSRGRVFSGREDDEAMRESAAALAAAAAREGYHGPAGVDGFRFRAGATGAESVLRPVVELNARFTMGTVTVGLLRRLLARVRGALALEPGERRAFWLGADRPARGWEAAREAAGTGSLLVRLAPEGEPLQPALLFARDAEALDRAGATA